MLTKNERKQRLEYFKEEMKKKCGDEYSLLSTEYINMRTKIEIRHNVCGTTFQIRPDAFLMLMANRQKAWFR